MIHNQQLLEWKKNNIQDLLCFSHLRWDFVYQRPQHLMSRFANQFRVFFIEEPVNHNGSDTLKISLSGENVWIVTPHLKENSTDPISVSARIRTLLNKFI